jgi:hypothetical protein
MKYLSSPKKILKEVRSFNFKDKKSLISVILYITTFVSLLSPFFTPLKANATVTEAFVHFDRLATTQLVAGTACLKTATSGTENGVVIDFPTGWTIPTAGNWTVSVTNLPTDPVGGGAATAWPNIATATISVVGLSVRFAQVSSMDLTTSVFYCFNFSGATSAIGSAGNDQTGTLKTTGGSPYVDSVGYAVSIVAAAGDQIVVTASVSATMTFTLSPTSLSLGTLSTSTVASASATQTVSTNARNGWVSWVKGSNATGLVSAIASANLASPGSYPTITDLASTTGYGLEVEAVAGTPVPAAGYWANQASSQTKVGHIDSTVFRQTASDTAPATSDQISINVHAKIPATQAAASDYTDTLTVVAAGSF